MATRKAKKNYDNGFFTILYQDGGYGMYSYTGKTYETFEEAERAAAEALGKRTSPFFIAQAIAKVAPKSVPVETTLLDPIHQDEDLTT